MRKVAVFISTTCITVSGRGQFQPRPGFIKIGVVYFSHALSKLQRSKNNGYQEQEKSVRGWGGHDKGKGKGNGCILASSDFSS